MNVCFRVDASDTIGSGHFTRCLTLANALRERGVTCGFVTRRHEGTLASLARTLNFDVTELPLMPAQTDQSESGYAGWIGATWQEDAKQTAQAIGPDGVDWLVVDHYGLDRRWEEAMRASCGKILAIDDLADRQHDCDLLLDQNLVAGMTTRYDGLVPEGCGMMLGTDYALLQPDYANLRDRIPAREGAVGRILVYFGGADRHNLTGRAVRALLDLAMDHVFIDVVANPESPFASDLADLAKRSPNVALHNRQKSLATLMAQADLALGAAGTTSWERCCMGLPTLLVTLAENQRHIAAELDNQKLAVWIGDVATITVEDIKQAVRRVVAQGSLYAWSAGVAKAVDGRGCERVVGYLTLRCDTPLTTRFATVADEALILDWANDPLSRRHAFSPERISPDTHHRWYHVRLRDLDNCIFLIVSAAGSIPIGQVRFERRDRSWEISYMLDQRCRGRGLGVPLLRAAIDKFAKLEPEADCFGRVKHDNVASNRIFERLGFACEAGGDVLTYRRHANQ